MTKIKRESCEKSFFYIWI